MRRKPTPQPTAVPSISTAAPALSSEQSDRMKRYLVHMGIRTACFFAAIATRTSWIAWVFIAAAVVLPYLAVVLANAGRDGTRYNVSTPHLTLPAAEKDAPPHD